MQGKRKYPSKKHASFRQYRPESQLSLGFDNPLGEQLDPSNRWVQLSQKIPWDELVNLYNIHHPAKRTGRPGISPRILIGAVIIKHLNDYDDRETIEQIRENVYLQHFLGFASFTTEAPFDASVFVSIRKKLTPLLLGQISERLMELTEEKLLPATTDSGGQEKESPPAQGRPPGQEPGVVSFSEPSGVSPSNPTHKGVLLMDATVAPQGIAYPTDLNLLNDSRKMSERIIDGLYGKLKARKTGLCMDLLLLQSPGTAFPHGVDPDEQVNRVKQELARLEELKKPRTYRELACRDYLRMAKNKKPSRKRMRVALGKQIRYLRRNLGHIDRLLNEYFAEGPFPLSHSLQRYYWIIQLLYDQQLEMYTENKHQVSHRLVSIHQPYVRPMVRGKARARVEFGAKVHLSLIDGFSFLDTISWDAFNEGAHLQEYVTNYRRRFGYYPEKVLVDQLYWTRANRKWLKERQIQLAAKPLGRPSAQAVEDHVRPGERNPVEGKFGQAKLAYGMNRIRAKLKLTSESWIASVVLVLNLVNLARVASYALRFLSFSNGATDYVDRIGCKWSPFNVFAARNLPIALVLGGFYND